MVTGFDELTLLEEPVQPELAPADQARLDAWHRTPDYTRMTGDPVYQVALVKELLSMLEKMDDHRESQLREEHEPAMSGGLSYEEAWAMSGAPDGAGEDFY